MFKSQKAMKNARELRNKRTVVPKKIIKINQCFLVIIWLVDEWKVVYHTVFLIISGFEISRGLLPNGSLNLKWTTKYSTVIVNNYTYWLPKPYLWSI